MNIREYWTQLKIEIDKFDAESKSEEKSKIDTFSDQKEYVKLRQTLIDVAKYGLEKTMDISKIKFNIRQGEELMKIAPFDAEGIPRITGNKTRDFIKQVYLPHVTRFEQVELSFTEKGMMALMGIDLAEKRLKAQEIVKKLNQMLKTYQEEKTAQISSKFLQPPPSSQPRKA